MGVSYDGIESALISESECGIWKAGKRCPDLELFQPASELPQRLYSKVPYGKFLILQIGDIPCRRHLSKDVVTYFTIRSPSDDTPSSATETEADKSEFDGFRSENVKQGESFLAVIRPDMYVGYVGDEAGADKYLSDILALST